MSSRDGRSKRSGSVLQQAFSHLDHTGDGRVGIDAVTHHLERMGLSIPADELKRLVERVDTQKDGALDFDEFQNVIAEVMNLRKDQSSAHINIDNDALEAASFKRNMFGAVMRVVIYMLIGGFYGSFRQGWRVLDSVYFVVVTATTVGFGDMSFVKGEWWEKVFGGIYVFCGVAFIGSAFGTLLDAMNEAASQEVKAIKKRTSMNSVGDMPSFDLDQEIKALRVKLYKYLGMVLVVVAIGTVVLVELEHEQGWTYADTFYFACVTMTTVGYGDITPKSDFGKMFTTIYILSGFGVIASAMTSLAQFPMEVRRLTNINKVLTQFGDSLDEQELVALCESEELKQMRTAKMIENIGEDHHVTRSEFVLWQLMKQGKLDFDEDISPCLYAFDKLDYDGSGDVSAEDIHRFLAESLAHAASPRSRRRSSAMRAHPPPITETTVHINSKVPSRVEAPPSPQARSLFDRSQVPVVADIAQLETLVEQLRPIIGGSDASRRQPNLQAPLLRHDGENRPRRV